MRCRAWAVTISVGTVLLAATVAFPVGGVWAAPSPAPVPAASPGTGFCAMDKELGGVTGLTLNGTGFAVTVHGTAVVNRVYLLTSACKLARSWTYGGNGPNDPQDIQAGPNDTYWVADTGDNPAGPTRTTVAVWKFTAEGRSTLYRLKYPDRAQSAQAMLVGTDGIPIIITDNPNGPAGIYVPSTALDPNKPVLLKAAGTVTPQDTGTENKLGKIGTSRVTGAASSRDGKKVAIRTYADAYEWEVPNGDAASMTTALTTATPKITPLPNEPQGTGLAYTTDGGYFLTTSDVPVAQGQILKYKASPAAPGAKSTPKAPAITTKGDTRSWFAKLNLQDLLRIVGGVGVLGLLMVVGGIIGIRRSRNRPPRDGGSGRRLPLPDDDLTNPPAVAMAHVPTGPPDRYGHDPYGDQYGGADQYGAGGQYGADDRHPGADDRPPPSGGLYGRPAEADTYGSPRRPAGSSTPPPRGGIARSHRPGNRRPRDREVDPNRRGYSDQHDGFRDMLE